MKNLYIDFDGVILNTLPPLYKALTDAGYDLSSEKDCATFMSNFDYRKILVDENIINDSINAIRELMKCGKYNVSILTHVHSLKEGEDKTRYVRRFLRDVTMILVPKSISKTQMVHTRDSILVDDFKGNLDEWISKGGIGVKFCDKKENMNKKDYIRINDLRSLLTMFEGEN